MFKAFTLVEMLLVIALLAIMSVFVIVILNPNDRIWRAQATQALSELKDFAKAIELYAVDNNSYPPDADGTIAPELYDYLTPKSSWPAGPFPGSVYDYDNWTDGRTCVDSSMEGSVQISLRNVSRRNPDNSNVWTWYIPILGNGGPHCEDINLYNKGECVNCAEFAL